MPAGMTEDNFKELARVMEEDDRRSRRKMRLLLWFLSGLAVGAILIRVFLI